MRSVVQPPQSAAGTSQGTGGARLLTRAQMLGPLRPEPCRVIPARPRRQSGGPLISALQPDIDLWPWAGRGDMPVIDFDEGNATSKSRHPRLELGETYLVVGAAPLDDLDLTILIEDHLGAMDLRGAESGSHPLAQFYGRPWGDPTDGLHLGGVPLDKNRRQDHLWRVLAWSVTPDNWFPEPLDEFRLGAAFVHDACELWRVVAGVLPPRDARYRMLPSIDEIWAERALGNQWARPEEFRSLWLLIRQAKDTFDRRQGHNPEVMGRLAAQMRAALLADLLADGILLLAPDLVATDPIVPVAPASATLWQRCMSELATHIQAGVVPRPCQRCGQLFVRQLGRSTGRRVRTADLKYCSTRCAQSASKAAQRARA